MRPVTRLLRDELIDRIIAEAREVLCRLGVEIHNQAVLSMLADHGAAVDKDTCYARFTEDIIDRALATVPRSFKLFDVLGDETHNFEDDNVYFTPGSTSLNILDSRSGEMRRPTTVSYTHLTLPTIYSV